MYKNKPLFIGITAIVLGLIGFGVIKSFESKSQQSAPTLPASENPVKTAQDKLPDNVDFPPMIVTAALHGRRLVVEGRGMPGTRIMLMQGERELSSSYIDAKGQWRLDKYWSEDMANPTRLRVSLQAKNGKIIPSEQGLIMAALAHPQEVQKTPSPVANHGRTPKNNQENDQENDQERPPQALMTDVLLLLTEPGSATHVLQTPYQQFPEIDNFAFVAIDYDNSGGVIFSGNSLLPGMVRIYIKDKFLNETHIDARGQWSLIAGKIMPQGKYPVTAELLRPEHDPVKLTLEFERIKLKSLKLSEDGDEAEVQVLQQENRLQIIRKLYGGGLQYTLIYAPDALQSASQ